MRSFLLLAGVSLFSFCLRAEEEKAENDQRFHKTLLEIAGCYERFGRVDDEGRWAPWLCRMPSPSVARESKSTDDATHGRKIYFIFASKGKEYLKLTESKWINEYHPQQHDEVKPAEPGPQKERERFQAEMNQHMEEPSEDLMKHLILVKESWTPKEVPADAIWGVSKFGKFTKSDLEKIGDEFDYCRDRVSPFLKKNGTFFKADKRGALFIMYRTEKDTPGTDEGWVYGTVTSDGKTVTSSGRVASCMGCHAEAPYPKEPQGAGRLFGLPEKVKKKGN